MTYEIGVVLVSLVAAVVLFATEKLAIDLVAIGLAAVLMLSGVITPQEGVSGFSNSATITVGAMFVLSAGLVRTGAVDYIGISLARIGRRSPRLMVVVMMLAVGFASAFVNNTAVVAVFMPVALRLSRDTGISASKLLIPLSFASICGGVCTLIGTSTNILMSAIIVQHGLPPFSMFEFSRLGAILLASGIFYMAAFGFRLIPNRRSPGDLTQTFGMGDYLTEIILLPQAESIGKPLRASPLVHDLDIDILGIYRGNRYLILPTAETILEANDLLRVRCNLEKIRRLQEREGVALKSGGEKDGEAALADTVLVEALISPNSPLEGKSLKGVGFRSSYGGTALAIRHHEQIIHERLGTAPLRAGDVLLIEIRRSRLEQLRRNPALVIVSEVGLPEFRRHKIIPTLAITAGVVGTAAFHLVPIMVSAIVGSVLLVLTGCITIEEAHDAIEWKVIFLLAGILPLGIAMEKSGAASMLSNAIIKGVGGAGPMVVMSLLMLLTIVLTNLVSHNATAVLIAPIAIVAAKALALDARPFLVAVTFAASLSFMTPIGYPTNVLIYGPGHYRFGDFLRVGTPLSLIFWLLATWLIPQFWPYR